MSEEEIRELIKRRRLQMLVHSYIYYELNSNVIPDNKWSEWAMELQHLQEKYKDIAKSVEYADEFENWDGSTGAFLKFDKKTIGRAYLILHIMEGKTW